jgi:DNA-binding XRE family transcriptional regulator
MTNLERIRKELSPARRKKVEARSAQLIAEEMTLQELRRARKLTQVRMAKELGIGQDGVSKLEKRADLMISTLRKTVEAMGGSLSLVAEFPDRESCRPVRHFHRWLGPWIGQQEALLHTAQDCISL